MQNIFESVLHDCWIPQIAKLMIKVDIDLEPFIFLSFSVGIFSVAFFTSSITHHQLRETRKLIIQLIMQFAHLAHKMLRFPNHQCFIVCCIKDLIDECCLHGCFCFPSRILYLVLTINHKPH